MAHPNARAAAGAGGTVAVVIYLLSLFGISVPDPPLAVGVAIGGAVSAIFLLVGRAGIRGVFRLLWRGSD